MQHLIAALHRQMRAFFAQPLAAKHAILRTADNPWGFYDRELTKHTPDWKQIYDYGPRRRAMHRPQWPAALPEFKPVIERSTTRATRSRCGCSRRISTESRHAGEVLDAHFRPAHTSFLRLNYYRSARRRATRRRVARAVTSASTSTPTPAR